MLNHPASSKKKVEEKAPCYDADGWWIWGSNTKTVAHSLGIFGNFNTDVGWGSNGFLTNKAQGFGSGGSPKVRVDSSLFTFNLQVQPIISNCPLLVNSFKRNKQLSHTILCRLYQAETHRTPYGLHS